MTIHKARIEPRDVDAIQASFDSATEDDAIDALRKVEEHNAPSKNDKGYAEALPVDKVLELAKGYLPAIVLHRVHGKPEKFITGPVATVEKNVTKVYNALDRRMVLQSVPLATQYVAISQRARWHPGKAP